jgi:hypothetical protein
MSTEIDQITDGVLPQETTEAQELARLGGPPPPEAEIQPMTTQEALESPIVQPPESVVEPPKARMCRITNHFGMNFIELMKQAPNNPLTRAHMLKVLKQMPPPEADTFLKLVDWVEFNFPTSFAVKRAPVSTARFNLDFSVRRTDIGGARYRINRSGTHTQSYNMEELREWIEDEESSFDDLDTKFYEKARENESCDFDDSGAYEYSEHEDTDNDGTDLDMQGDGVDRMEYLLSFLRANGGEDLAVMLEEREN